MYANQVPERVTQMQEGCAAMSRAGGGYDGDFPKTRSAIGQEIRQSEIEGQVHHLLNTAESLEKCVAVLLGRIEKVTTSEPKSEGKTPVPCQVMNTILGRDLDSINGRIQSSISTLRSAIDRIEL